MDNNGLPAFHPGEYVAELLEELGISQAQLARTLGVSPMRVSHVIAGSRPVTAEWALLLGKAFGQSARYWLNLQAEYDLKRAEKDKDLCSRLSAVSNLAPIVAEPRPS